MICVCLNSMDELEEKLLDIDQSCRDRLLYLCTKTMIMAVTNDVHDTPRRVTSQSAVEPVEVVEMFECLSHQLAG